MVTSRPKICIPPSKLGEWYCMFLKKIKLFASNSNFFTFKYAFRRKHIQGMDLCFLFGSDFWLYVRSGSRSGWSSFFGYWILFRSLCAPLWYIFRRYPRFQHSRGQNWVETENQKISRWSNQFSQHNKEVKQCFRIFESRKLNWFVVAFLHCRVKWWAAQYFFNCAWVSPSCPSRTSIWKW